MDKNEVINRFEACKACGACFNACEAYKALDPKCIKKIVKALANCTLSVDDAHTAYRCNLCGYCQTKCPQNLNLAQLFGAVRVSYCKSGQGPLSYHAPMRTDKKINFFSLNDETPHKKPVYSKQAARVFFPGCSMRTFRPDLVLKVSRYFGDALVLNGDECCGKSFKSIGLEDEYETHNAKMVSLLEDLKPSEVIVACPNCYTSFKSKIKFAQVTFVEQALLNGASKFKKASGLGVLAVHDSCPFKEAPETFNFAREFVDGIYDGKRVELSNSKEKLRCCGGGGGVSFANEKLSRRISGIRLREAKAAGADTLATFCVSCAIQFGSVSRKEGVRIVHALDLLEPMSTPDYGEIYRRSRKQFSGGKLFVNLLRLSLQV